MTIFKSIFCLILLSSLYIGCEVPGNQNTGEAKTAETHDHDEHDDHDHDGELTGDGVHFGERIDAEAAISYDELLLKMEGMDSVHTKVIGTVDEVCQAKGCWMTIRTADEDKETMTVEFKDYGFFMPKDIQGRTVVMEGKAFRELTSVEDLRHYAEDAGDSPEEIAKITEPKNELKFLAHGVMLMEQ